MLKLQPTEAEWLEVLPGVRVKFAPITIKAVRAAREATRIALGEDATDFEGAGDALSRELIRRGILEWAGVGDRDGEPLEVTSESIEMFLADPTALQATNRIYVMPWVRRDLEGNGYAGSPSGIGVGATPAKDIALSSARRTRKAAVGRTRKRARKDAHTA